MYKVVIVDDEELIVTGLTRMLPWAKYGCEVVGSTNSGERALKLVHHLNPDILFTDIKMPGMDGLALIAALRHEYPTMQITILSGYPDFEYARQAIQLGVSSYILKPSKMAELEGAVRDMVAKLDEAAARRVHTQVEPAGEGTPPRQEVDTQQESSPGADASGNFIARNALQYIEEHYSEKLTLADVADRVYVSQWHLSKLISKTYGQSFSDLLNGVRIRKAKQLLADPSLKIWEISEQVGFCDVTHFSRIFKKLESCSANEYRNTLAPKPPMEA